MSTVQPGVYAMAMADIGEWTGVCDWNLCVYVCWWILLLSSLQAAVHWIVRCVARLLANGLILTDLGAHEAI